MAKKNILIEVDGENKILRLGFNGLIELEETLGKGMTAMSDGDIKFKDLRTMFYIALKHGGEKDVTEEKTGEYLDTIISEKGMEYLSEKLAELFQLTMGATAQNSFLSAN